jgi:DNA-binding NarL/FixJ family response regulator
MSHSLRIALIDWNTSARAARAQILNATAKMDVVFESDGNSNELAILSESLVDVIVIDQQLRQGSGVDAFSALRSQYPELSEVPKAVLTAPFNLPELRVAALEAGIHDIVAIESGPEALIETILAAAADQATFDLATLFETLSNVDLPPKGDYALSQAINALPVRKRAVIDRLQKDWQKLKTGANAKFSLDSLDVLLAPLGSLTNTELVIKLLRNGFLYVS